MKKQLLSMLVVVGLLLSFGGMVMAVDLPIGPFIFKTWNHEIGTTYFGGEAGKLYFLNAGQTVFTEEFGEVTHTAADGLISDLGSVRPDGLEDGEDTFGIFNITTLWEGDILPVDSRFGDGSAVNLLGNDITTKPGGIQWFEGMDNGRGQEFLRGLFFGGVDVLVECVVPDEEFKIWSEDGEFVIYEVLDDAAYNPATEAGKDPTARVTTDEFPGWFDPNSDTLEAKGSIVYQRFQADLANIPDNIFDGQTEVLLTIDDGAWNPAPNPPSAFVDWWEAPDGTMAHVWQTWNIGDPYVLSNGWTGSEDSARGFITEEELECLVEVTVEGCVNIPPPPPCGNLCTFTIGGWGTSCNGNNPGCFRDAKFDLVFPGGLVIGDQDGIDGDGLYAAIFTSSSAIEAYLPDGGTPAVLDADLTDPTSTPAGILAAQLTGVALAVGMSDAGAFDGTNGFLQTNPIPLGDQILTSGPFSGLSIRALLQIGHEVVSGDLSSLNGNSLSDLNEALTGVNESFVGCPDDDNDDCDGQGQDPNVCITELPAGEGAFEVEYTYEITNTSAVTTLTNVVVIDDTFGEVPGSPIVSILPGETVTLTLIVSISEETTNIVTVIGSVDGIECEDAASVTITKEEEPPPPSLDECTTKIKAMLLEYTGPDIPDATVEIVPKWKDGGSVVYSGVNLTAGVILSSLFENDFTVDAAAHSQKDLGAKTNVIINGVEELLHTSCSTPFVIGAPAPLDNPSGDPSPNWFVLDFEQK